MTTPTTVDHLARFARGIQIEAIPNVVIEESKRALLDSVGCALGAIGMDRSGPVLKVAAELGGPGEATIFGRSGKVSTSAATFANGELMAALDFDVCHIPPGHVSPYVIPAALATAEKLRVSGPALLRALAVAHEIGVRMGTAMAYYRDLKEGEKISFPAVTGFSGSVFAGTLGVALIMGLNEAHTASALGIAGRIAPAQSLTQWTRTLPATDEKYLMAGWIGQAEIMAASLAAGGFRGDTGVLDGEFGFYRYMGSSKWNRDALIGELGQTWKTPAVTIFKPYPHCRLSQTVLDCVAGLVAEHQLRPEEIDRIRTYCDPHGAVLELWRTTEVHSAMEAQMSIPWAVSMVAHKVPRGPEWQDNSVIRDVRYRAFMGKVEVLPHPHFEQCLAENSQARIGKVEIEARGKTFLQERMFRKGSPATADTRMSDDELSEKFRRNASRVLTPEASEKIIESIMNLDSVGDVSELCQLWKGSTAEEMSRVS